MAEAASSNPTRFRELLHQLKTMQESARVQQQRERELLQADPYDLEAQKKIAEAIRQEQVLENMEQAMETMPESFGSVHMLYVNVCLLTASYLSSRPDFSRPFLRRLKSTAYPSRLSSTLERKARSVRYLRPIASLLR